MKNDVSIELRKKARMLKLCDKWFHEWADDTDNQTLINMYFRGADFCLMHHYPSNEYIKEHFDKSLLRKNGILVDDTYSLLNPIHVMSLGSSKSTIRTNARNFSIVYARDKSALNIIAKNDSFVIIHAMDNASITVTTQDNAKVVILKNSNDTEISAFGNIQIKDDFDFLK